MDTPNGQRKEHLLTVHFQRSSCSAHSSYETYGFFQEVSPKHYLGMHRSVDIYNVVSSRHDDLRSAIILGTAYRCQKHYSGN